MVMGAPLEVPADAGESVIEEKRVELERCLEGLQRRALSLLGQRDRPKVENQ